MAQIYNYDTSEDCYWDAFCSDDPTDYKPAGIKDVKLHGNSIYPNPASGELYIGLDKSIAATAVVEAYLVSMQGQVIGNLYKGSAAGLRTDSRVALPPVATGLYMVQVVADGNVLMQQKLSIQ